MWYSLFRWYQSSVVHTTFVMPPQLTQVARLSDGMPLVATVTANPGVPVTSKQQSEAKDILRSLTHQWVDIGSRWSIINIVLNCIALHLIALYWTRYFSLFFISYKFSDQITYQNGGGLRKSRVLLHGQRHTMLPHHDRNHISQENRVSILGRGCWHYLDGISQRIRKWGEHKCKLPLDCIGRLFFFGVGTLTYLKQQLWQWRAQVDTTARPFRFIHYDPVIQRKQRDFREPKSQQNNSKLNDDLSEIQNIMKKNIDEILNRGEKLDHVSTISQELQQKSKDFKWGAKKLTWQARMQQYGPVVAGSAFVLLVLYFKFFYGRGTWIIITSSELLVTYVQCAWIGLPVELIVYIDES